MLSPVQITHFFGGASSPTSSLPVNLEREREGRRNRYRLNPELPLWHPLEREHPIGDILGVPTPLGHP